MTEAFTEPTIGYRESLDCDRCGCAWTVEASLPEDQQGHFTCCPYCGVMCWVKEEGMGIIPPDAITTLFDPQDEAQLELLGLKRVMK